MEVLLDGFLVDEDVVLILFDLLQQLDLHLFTLLGLELNPPSRFFLLLLHVSFLAGRDLLMGGWLLDVDGLLLTGTFSLLSFARLVLLLICGRGTDWFFLGGFWIGIGMVFVLGGWLRGLGVLLFSHAGVLRLSIILNKPSLFLLGVITRRRGTTLSGSLDSSRGKFWFLSGLLLLFRPEDGLDVCLLLHFDIHDAFLLFLFFGVNAFGLEG